MAARCSSSSAGIRTTADMRSCQTTRLLDALPDALPDERADQAEQQAGRPAEQMDIQTDRCTARDADGHAEQMHEQQKKLNPIKDFTGLARNIPNAVSAKNP